VSVVKQQETNTLVCNPWKHNFFLQTQSGFVVSEIRQQLGSIKNEKNFLPRSRSFSLVDDEKKVYFCLIK
jgi:hypothetical protein